MHVFNSKYTHLTIERAPKFENVCKYLPNSDNSLICHEFYIKINIKKRS